MQSENAPSTAPHVVAEIDAALDVVRQRDVGRPSTAEPLRTLAEWLADPARLEPPKLIIPHLVLAGRVTLLAAREKAGKSTLLGQAVATFSRGGEFLGQPCGPGRVIWYAIDEPAPDAVRRLHGSRADESTVVIQERKPTPEHLRAHLDEFKPDLIVVDTLTELLTGRLQSDRDAMDMSRALGPYMDVLRETETAAVFVHHSTKDGKDYRGSGQLGAKVDVIAMLRIPMLRGPNGAAGEPDEDPDVDPELEVRRILEVKGRGILARERLFFDGEEYRLGEGELTLSARILRAVDAGEDSANKVVEKVRGRRETVIREVNALVASGELLRDGARLRRSMISGGTVGGTGLSARSHTIGITTGLHRNHRDFSDVSSGIATGTDHAEVVPESDTYTADSGTAHVTGPGVEPFDWNAVEAVT